MTKISREYTRRPEGRGVFARIARRQGWSCEWTYWAEGRSRDGYQVTGMGRTEREARNDLVRQRQPHIPSPYQKE